MNKSEVIIELGAEGGCLALYGVRTEGGWLFTRQVTDWTPELIDEDRVEEKSAAIDSWEAALDLLDQYRWYALAPIVIHPEFRERILIAVQERLHHNLDNSQSELKRWHEFCR